MKPCLKCTKLHNKPGTYCSRSCANSRVWSEDQKKKKSESLKKFISENDSWFENQRKVLDLRIANQKDTLYKKHLDRFLKGLIADRGTLKKWLILLRGEECEICKIGPSWNGLYLSLQVDHVNGVNSNNTPENLRLLCPNCHTQTHTYAGKNIKRT